MIERMVFRLRQRDGKWSCSWPCAERTSDYQPDPLACAGDQCALAFEAENHRRIRPRGTAAHGAR